MAGATIHPPRQARSHATLERALEAGASILREGDLQAFTVAEVCRRSGVTNGALYKRFPSKRALLLAVHERVLAEVESDAHARFAAPGWDELTTPALIDRAVALVAGVMHRNERLFGALMVASQTDPEVLARGVGSARRLGAEFDELVLRRRSDLAHPNPELAVTVCSSLLLNALARQIVAPPVARSPVTRTTLVAELATICRSYLLATVART